MIKPTRRPAKGFTLIELLTVIAIIGILAGIIIPTVGKVQQIAQKTVDSANLHSIAQAAIAYATDNDNKMPDPIENAQRPASSRMAGGSNYFVWIGILAKSGGLNDPKFYFSKIEQQAAFQNSGTLTNSIVNPENKNLLIKGFTEKIPAFEFIGGLRVSDPSSTPLGYTRGLKKDGTWDATRGTYGDVGGHVVFTTGNVKFYTSLDGSNALTATNGRQTSDIRQAIPMGGNQRLYGPSKGTVLGKPEGALPIPATR